MKRGRLRMKIFEQGAETDLVQAEKISTNPDPFEPYHISQGIRIGQLLFLSGQASITKQGEIVGLNDFDAQAEQVFSNLKEVLEAGDSNLKQIVKVTIYLTDMQYFPKIVDLRKKYFSEPYPADTIVEVKSLALPGLMIEIDAIALINK